jgi:phospho-N-acetylmuramoyl-pentapeptide-transferase
MLYYWLVVSQSLPLKGISNLFRYLTFRTLGAILTALLIGLFLGKPFIAWLKKKQAQGQPIREDGPQEHLIKKKGTPTMGGLLILFSLTLSTLLWSDIRNPYIWIVIGVTLGFGMLGAMDDYLKLTHQSSYKGLSAKLRISVEIIICFIAFYCLQLLNPLTYDLLSIPFLKNIFIELGFFFIPFSMIVVVGAANAVNLTDGLDGLAIVPVMMVATCFAIISYAVGNFHFAHYLQIFYIPHVGELAIFCGSLIGSGLAFLWYNAPPARVFMGDTGSLAAGSAIGILGVITKHEFVLALMGGVFVVEALSVIIQVLYFKMTRKRIFLMAPIHHHFEKKGWAESTIVIRFWIISAVLALMGLATLKIR